MLIAWGLLAAAFVPLITVYALGRRPSEATALVMMGIGIAVFLLWRELGLSHLAYEAMPAIVAGLAVYFVVPTRLRSRASNT